MYLSMHDTHKSSLAGFIFYASRVKMIEDENWWGL